MSREEFRSRILLGYRVLGPLIIGFWALLGAVSLGWIENPIGEGGAFAIVMLAVLSLPVLIVVSVVGSVLFAHDWPFVLPLWLLAPPVLLFVGHVFLELPELPETVYEVMLAAAVVAATIVGYLPRKR